MGGGSRLRSESAKIIVRPSSSQPRTPPAVLERTSEVPSTAPGSWRPLQEFPSAMPVPRGEQKQNPPARRPGTAGMECRRASGPERVWHGVWLERPPSAPAVFPDPPAAMPSFRPGYGCVVSSTAFRWGGRLPAVTCRPAASWWNAVLWVPPRAPRAFGATHVQTARLPRGLMSHLGLSLFAWRIPDGGSSIPPANWRDGEAGGDPVPPGLGGRNCFGPPLQTLFVHLALSLPQPGSLSGQHSGCEFLFSCQELAGTSGASHAMAGLAGTARMSAPSPMTAPESSLRNPGAPLLRQGAAGREVPAGVWAWMPEAGDGPSVCAGTTGNAAGIGATHLPAAPENRLRELSLPLQRQGSAQREAAPGTWVVSSDPEGDPVVCAGAEHAAGIGAAQLPAAPENVLRSLSPPLLRQGGAGREVPAGAWAGVPETTGIAPSCAGTVKTAHVAAACGLAGPEIGFWNLSAPHRRQSVAQKPAGLDTWIWRPDAAPAPAFGELAAGERASGASTAAKADAVSCRLPDSWEREGHATTFARSLPLRYVALAAASGTTACWAWATNIQSIRLASPMSRETAAYAMSWANPTWIFSPLPGISVPGSMHDGGRPLAGDTWSSPEGNPEEAPEYSPAWGSLPAYRQECVYAGMADLRRGCGLLPVPAPARPVRFEAAMLPESAYGSGTATAIQMDSCPAGSSIRGANLRQHELRVQTVRPASAPVSRSGMRWIEEQFPIGTGPCGGMQVCFGSVAHPGSRGVAWPDRQPARPVASRPQRLRLPTLYLRFSGCPTQSPDTCPDAQDRPSLQTNLRIPGS